jgi:multicomponent Na+:H+ antiporter subunit B
MRSIAAVLFTGGLGFLLLVIASQLGFGEPPMRVGQGILDVAAGEVGAANIVTSVLLAYRGLDTLGELSILFAAATAAGLALGHRRSDAPSDPDGGFILRAGADLLFPLLLVVGFYIILHGHLTPGGGFQGGVILAAAFFIGVLARPGEALDHAAIVFIEGLAGAVFIGIGLWALLADGAFLKPMLGQGTLGTLLSAGTLPLLSLAIGLKVGSELAGLMTSLSGTEAREP